MLCQRFFVWTHLSKLLCAKFLSLVLSLPLSSLSLTVPFFFSLDTLTLRGISSIFYLNEDAGGLHRELLKAAGK